MADMKVRDFDDMKVPSRRPWIIGVAVLIVAVGLYRHFSAREPAPREELIPVEEMVQGQRQETVAPSADLNQLLASAKAMERDGELQLAREKYYLAYDQARDTRLRQSIEERLGAVNVDLLLSPRRMPEKTDYVVQRGDSLQLIANRAGTTVELLQRSNQIMDPNRIKAGDLLRVFSGKFRIDVNKTRNDLVLTMNGRFFKRYRVATGKYGKTPIGSFKVRDKVPNPTWWRPDGKEVPFGDKENILGTRWMSIRATDDTPDVGGYGIHGTWDDTSIGSSASAGCIRMVNSDVEELFTMVPVGTPVIIEE